MFRRLVVTVALACFFQSFDMQNAEAQKLIATGRTPDGTVWIGRDPENVMDQFYQLSDRQIRSNLGLDSEVEGKLAEVMSSYERKLTENLRRQRFGEITREESHALRAQAIKDAVSLVEEILSPTERKRLVQCMYWLEVERAGIGDALTYGRLAKAVGVYDDQKTFLREKAEEIEAEMEEAIREIKARARKKLLSHLSPEQRHRADDILGEPMHYEIRTPEQEMYKRYRDGNFSPAAQGLPVRRITKRDVQD